MANLFFPLAVPASNGVGAGVDVSQLGMTRTITVAGSFLGTVTIEGSAENIAGPYAPIVSFNNVADERVVNIAAPFMRVRRSGVPGVGIPGTPTVDVGGNDNGTLAANVVAPAGNGVGAAVNIANLGTFKTLYVTGTFSGTLTWEFSEDGADWSQIKSFQKAGLISVPFTALFARLRRSGVSGVAGLPDCAIAAVNDPISIFVAGGAGNCLIFQPGGAETGPTIFNDWADLIAQLATLRNNSNGGGCYTIAFDDEFVTPVVVPAGAYAMEGCTWVPMHDPTNGSYVFVNLASGVTLTDLYNYAGPIRVTSLAAVAAPVTLANNEIYEIRDGAIVRAGAAAPYFSGASLLAGHTVVFQLDDVATLGDSVNDTINFSVAGSICVLSLGSQGEVFANALSIAVGAILAPVWRNTSAFINGTQPAVLGTVTHTTLTNERWRIRTEAGAAVSAAFGDQIGSTPPGGGQTITLPTITTFSRGQAVSVKRLASANALTIAAAVGQTIDGAATLSAVDLQGFLLVNDGGTRWRAIADFGNPPLATATPTQIDLGDAGAVGVATRVAREDHEHPFPAPAVVSTNLAETAGSLGVSTVAAREDHLHAAVADVAIEISDSLNGEGVSTDFSRADHLHAHGDRGGGTLHALATALIAGFMSAADKTKLDGLSAVLAFGDGNIGAAAGTRFLAPWNSSDATVASSALAEEEMPTPSAGTLRSLFVRHDAAPGGGGPSVVYTVMVNGVATALTVTLATGAVGQASDLVNSVVVAQGDLIALRAFKAMAIGGGGILVRVTMELV